MESFCIESDDEEKKFISKEAERRANFLKRMRENMLQYLERKKNQIKDREND